MLWLAGIERVSPEPKHAQDEQSQQTQATSDSSVRGADTQRHARILGGQVFCMLSERLQAVRFDLHKGVWWSIDLQHGLPMANKRWRS
jgi:hypothetical protein